MGLFVNKSDLSRTIGVKNDSNELYYMLLNISDNSDKILQELQNTNKMLYDLNKKILLKNSNNSTENK